MFKNKPTIALWLTFLISMAYLYSPILALNVDIPTGTSAGNYSGVSVNNTNCWLGHCSNDASWLTGYIEADPEFYSWLGGGGVCDEGDKCGYFSTCSQITDPEGCGVLTSESDPKAYNGTLAFNSSLINYYPILNPLNFLNITTIDNQTIVRNNTSPTFIDLIVSTLNFNNLLSIDIGNRLLYDLASKLSIDYNDRILYASDGTTKALDWYNVGIANFGNTRVNSSSGTFTNATIVNLNVTNINSNVNFTANATIMGYNFIDRKASACSPLPCKSQCSNNSGGFFINVSAC